MRRSRNAASVADSARALLRPVALRCWLRLDSARPSAPRIMGTARISRRRSRSLTMRLMTASCYPFKVPGAAGAFQLCVHLARAYPYFRCALWIHLLYIGCEDDVHAGRFQKFRIGLECPRVVAVIIAVSKVGKLQRVYKNTRHNQVVLRSCSTDQA